MQIYAISQLFHRKPTLWVSTFRRMEQSRDYMRAQYAPLRGAIEAELRSPGTGWDVLRSTLVEVPVLTHPQVSVRERTLNAFSVFLAKVRPQIARVVESYLDADYDPPPVDFNGHDLQGRFHMCVETVKGETRYVYFHASQWSKDQIDAYLELLCVLAEKRHGATRDDVWFVDLGSGIIQKPKRSFLKTRKDLEKTIEVLEMVQRAGNLDYEAA